MASLSPCQNDSGVEMTIADALSLASPEPELELIPEMRLAGVRVGGVGGDEEFGGYFRDDPGRFGGERRQRTKGRMPMNRKW